MSKTTPRLYLQQNLAAGAEIDLAAEQAHYLLHVLRCQAGDAVRVFNENQGEFLSYLTAVTKKTCKLRCEKNIAAVLPPPDIEYVFAPLKSQRFDYLVQKAVELGAAILQPVLTQHTIVRNLNHERLRANAIEAAEQCNLVFLPQTPAEKIFEKYIAERDQNRSLVFCDERAATASPLAALQKLKLPVSVIVGPEGGFSATEREILLRQKNICPISLGPRIMRADTAAVAALTLVQAALGDMRG